MEAWLLLLGPFPLSEQARLAAHTSDADQARVRTCVCESTCERVGVHTSGLRAEPGSLNPASLRVLRGWKLETRLAPAELFLAQEHLFITLAAPWSQ